MDVVVGKRTWRMSKKEYHGFLEMVSEQVPFGIYAVEKGSKAELRVDKCKSISQLKALKRNYRQQGFKVYANTGL